MRNRLISDRKNALSDAKIVAAESRYHWYRTQFAAGKRDVADLTCPESHIATPESLADWLPKFPDAVHAGLSDALGRAGWRWERTCDGASIEAVNWGTLRPVPPSPPTSRNGLIGHLEGAASLTAPLSVVPTRAVQVLVSAWQKQQDKLPVPIRAVDTDVFPTVILTRSVAVVDERAPSYYLSRFNRAAHRDAHGQLTLGFEHPEMGGPTLPANVWTLQLAEAEKRGKGLPAALRAFLAAIVHVPLHARQVTNPTDPAVILKSPHGGPLTLRHFLSMVYSGRTRPGEYWHVLHGVRSVLHSEAADVPYEWNGRIWTRSVVRMDGIPEGAYETAMLDEPWPVSVWLPPGDGTGPAVAWELLLKLMCTDATAARLLINLAYRWHVEGKRLHPVGRGKRKRWLYRTDPKVYDRFTDREADLYAFPPGTGRARRDKRIKDGWDAVGRLIMAGGVVHVDGRLLPPQASDGYRP
ncbi:MAG: hypothetical protein OXI70_10850 [Chloroflexota bacterium]|nr:hypothetical protein [Chloroflexota bacterium]